MKSINQEAIKHTIDEVEKKTNGEVVPAIVEQSDFYPASHFRLSLIISFLLSILFYLVPYEWSDTIYYIYIQVIGLVLGYFLAFKSSIKKLFSTSSELNEETHQMALEMFHKMQVHNTVERNGVLLFVSVLEHRVEIVPDISIDKVVDKKEWKNVIKQMIPELKKSNYELALKLGINEIGKILEQHFPKTDCDKNTIENKLFIGQVEDQALKTQSEDVQQESLQKSQDCSDSTQKNEQQ